MFGSQAYRHDSNRDRRHIGTIGWSVVDRMRIGTISWSMVDRMRIGTISCLIRRSRAFGDARDYVTLSIHSTTGSSFFVLVAL